MGESITRELRKQHAYMLTRAKDVRMLSRPSSGRKRNETRYYWHRHDAGQVAQPYASTDAEWTNCGTMRQKLNNVLDWIRSDEKRFEEDVDWARRYHKMIPCLERESAACDTRVSENAGGEKTRSNVVLYYHA